MQKPPVKVGLIGLGKMGQNHLRVLSMLKSVELVFVYDFDAALTERLASTFGTQACSDLEKMLDHVDAVVIATPTITHSSYIYQAAKYVKNIFVEKPLAGTLEESEAIAEFSAKNGINIQVGFIERFNPAVDQLKKVIDKSQQVVSIDFTRTNKLSSRITDVDVVTDLMIHDIDLACYLSGPVVSVAAHGVEERGMIEFASALLTHANGRFSRVQASRITDKKIRNIEATCIDMFVGCELLRKEIIITRQSEIRQKAGEPYVISAIEESVEVRPQEALLSELQAFVELCRGEPQVLTPSVDDGLQSMKICDQIQKAIYQ